MKHIWAITAVGAVLGFAGDLILGQTPPGFVAGLGFVGCALIVFVSKWLGASLLQRPEDYYSSPVDTSEPEVQDPSAVSGGSSTGSSGGGG